MIGVRRRLVLTVLAVVIALSGGLAAVGTAEGIGLIHFILGRALTQTISLQRAERDDRSNINQRRDAERAAIEEAGDILDYWYVRGWIDEDRWATEAVRLKLLRDGVDERAKRERQIVSFQTRHRVRTSLASAVSDVLKLSTGANPRVIEFVEALLRGEKPLTAAVQAATTDPSVADPREPLRQLRDDLRGVREAWKQVKDRVSLRTLEQLDESIGVITRIVEGDQPALPAEDVERLQTLAERIEAARRQAGLVVEDLFPGSPRVDRTRFAHEPKWIALNDIVETLADTTDADKAVVSGIYRASLESIAELIPEDNLKKMTIEQIQNLAGRVTAKLIDELATGKRLRDIDIDKLRRSAINEYLGEQGLELLPEPEEGEGSAGTQPESGEGVATDPRDLDEPTIVIEFRWEAEDQLLFNYSAAHESNGDPTQNPAGGISAVYGAGCNPDAFVYAEPLPLVLTLDQDFEDASDPATAREPGTYSIVAWSNAWCVYYFTDANGVQIADKARADATMARFPEGTEITVTAKVTYYNIPGAEPQTFTAKVPVTAGVAGAANTRVLGTVVLPSP